MEHMNVFHRIFHEDLHPLTNQKSREYYVNYFKSKSKDEYINSHLRQKSLENFDDQELKFFYYEDLLKNSLTNFKRDLTGKLFLFLEQNKSIENLVKSYQMFVLGYMNIIDQDYLFGEDKQSVFQISELRSNADIFKIIYRTLDAILLYIEQIFPRYLDQSLSIPYQQRLWFVNRYQETISGLLRELNKLEAPEIIVKEISKVLSQISSNTLPDLTYESRDYYKILIKVLDHLFTKENQPTLDKLYSVLISLDYNTFKVFFFMTKQVKDSMKDYYTNEEKLQIYQQYLKKVKTTAVTVSFRLNPDLPSLKEKLIEWVNEEILFYKQLTVLENDIEKENSFKRKLLKMSVPEMSLWTKLLYECRLIDGPKTEVFTFLSSVFRTPKSSLISTESLSNNYYSVSESSKRSVRSKLNGMLLQLDQMKGDL